MTEPSAGDAPSGTSSASVQIGWHDGPREELGALFAEAEDSTEQLAAYRDLGRVLVARRDGVPIGHLQLVETAEPGQLEIKNMAVVDSERGSGIGRALVQEALRRSADEGVTRVVVATAAADPGNLRFYQRLGFRMQSVEQDAFTPATGYPDPIYIDGVLLRDRVWLAQVIGRSDG
jgi:predicted N-acetyltransferase YhbS